MVKELPEFESEEEEAKFWSENDAPEYWNDAHTLSQQDIQVSEDFKQKTLENSRKKKPVSLRLEWRQIREAKRIATKKGIPYQTLMRSWIEQGIRHELESESSEATWFSHGVQSMKPTARTYWVPEDIVDLTTTISSGPNIPSEQHLVRS